MSDSELGKALFREAAKIWNARCELRDSESERDERLARDLNEAAELVRILSRIVDGKSIREAFGAPGDFGYETPIGSALYRYYSEPRT